MSKVILGMQMTLDGYIAGQNGEMSWVDTGNEAWEHNFEMFNSTDIVLLGRVVYEGFMHFWPAAGRDPKATKYDKKYSAYIEKAKKYVFSRTLDRADWNNTTIIAGEDLAQEVADLKKENDRDLLLAGGAGLARSFADLNLIDEYRLLIVPRIIGGGTPFLSGIKNRINLKLLNVRSLKTGTVAAHYGKN